MHILVTTDFSEEARRPYLLVNDLVRAAGATLTLMHVVQVLPGTPQGGRLGTAVEPPSVDPPTAEGALEREAKEHFSDLDVKLHMASGPNIAELVTGYAAENDVDLIALSTHGRSGLKRMVMGSVAEQVLRRASVPVLCFPAAE